MTSVPYRLALLEAAIAAGAGTGSVTSVALTAPTGFTVTGSPITTTGTLALTTTLSGYVKGNGSGFTASATVPGSDLTGAATAAGLTMSTARLLGRTTAATGAIEEITVGTGLTLSAGTLSASGGSGTVTSVALSGGTTGLTVTGSPITTSGTITLAGTLGVANGGTGTTATPTNGQLHIGNGTGFALATLTAGSNVTITNSAGGISIAATGGGGGLFSPATAASFSLASGDATNLTLTDNANVGLLIDGGAPFAAGTARIAYRTLTTPANNWDMIASLDFLFETTNYSGLGLIMQDSTGGRAVGFSFGNDGTVTVANYTSLAAWSANASSTTLSTAVRYTVIRFMRIAKSGTALTFYLSADGVNWYTIYTTTATAWMANNPNRVGYNIGYTRGTGQNIKASSGYFSLTGTAV